MGQVEERLLKSLKEVGVDLVISMPETKLHDIVGKLYEQEDMIHIPICREEEGIGICAGAYMGGKKPVMIIPNAGFLNCANALTTLNLLYHLPLLMLISYRGDFGEMAFFHAPLGRVTEKVLQALEIPFQVLRNPRDLEVTVKDAQKLAEVTARPVALLLSNRFFQECEA